MDLDSPRPAHVALVSSPSSSAFPRNPKTVVTVPPYARNDPVDIDESDDDESRHAAAEPHNRRDSGSGNALVRNNTIEEHQWSTFAKYHHLAHKYRNSLARHSRSSHGSRLSDPEKDANAKRNSLLSIEIAAHHAPTPGWESPWQPYAHSPNNSISDFTHLDTHGRAVKKKRAANLQNFLLNNPFAPLFFRVLNITVTSSTLAVAIRIWHLQRQNDVAGIIGRSPLLAIICGPLTLAHVMTNIYLEYFGRPIGLWPLHLKMFHTLVELVAISLWSAVLSLAFDDYFSNPLACVNWQPNTRFAPKLDDDMDDIDQHERDLLCSYQVGLISLVFVGLMLYACVLVVSLFRIASRVSP